MQDQISRKFLTKEACLHTLYIALTAIRAAKDVEQARKIAHVFHNLPSRLAREGWADEGASKALEELEANAAATGLTDELNEWLDAAADIQEIAHGAGKEG
jgi:hypothetical protein